MSDELKQRYETDAEFHAEVWVASEFARIDWHKQTGQRIGYRDRELMLLAAMYAVANPNKGCVCNVGVQECPVHPDRLWSEEKRKQFGIDFNARVMEGKSS